MLKRMCPTIYRIPPFQVKENAHRKVSAFSLLCTCIKITIQNIFFPKLICHLQICCLADWGQEPFPCHGIPYNWQVPTDNMTLSTQMSKKSYRRLSSEAHSLWPETFHIFQKSDFHLLPQCNKIFPTVRLQSNNLSVCHLWQCRQVIGLASHFQMSKMRMRKHP